MEDYLRIDSHKLMYHISRVNDWLKGKTVCPIYLEIAPAGSCNHRCVFCALDYLNYKTSFLDLPVLKRTINQAGALGVKSIMFAGEGEPLLHKDIASIIRYTRNAGIDAAVTTNGVLLKKELSVQILKYLSWIRVSLNAGSSQTYAKIHRTGSGDFARVLRNLSDAVRIKHSRRLPVTIGVQLLLIPQNVKEVGLLAGLLKKLGVDYLIVKPYSQHPLSGSRISKSFRYADCLPLARELQEIGSDRFKIIFRSETMRRIGNERDYRHCLGLPFWAYINACGDVFSCSAFLGNRKFCFGNIYKTRLRDIMTGRRRQDILKMAATRLNTDKCREVCRLDKINAYLWELKHPGPHVNFI